MKIFRNNPRNFLRCFLIMLLTPLILVITFNVVVDPYWYFDIINIKGFNNIKYQATHKVRMTKAHQVFMQQPSNIILGTSRVEIGLDPTYEAWKNFPGTTYNMGLGGIGIGELSKTVKHSYYASKQLKLMLIVLDFLMFNAHRETVVFGTEVIDFDEDRLALNRKGSKFKSFMHDIDSLIGSTATIASWRTLHEQDSSSDLSKVDYYLQNGMRDPLNNPLRIVTEANGHNFVFSGQERAYVDKIWRAGPAKRYCLCLNDNKVMETFREIIAFAYEHNIDLRLAIGPEHARMLLAIKEAGLWVQFEEWKQELVRIIDEEALRYNKPAIALWDFSGFNSVTTESIPPEGDKTTQMTWYWEGSHYKTQTGNVILDKVLDYQGSTLAAPKDFGILLTSKNLQAHLFETRYQMSLYENNFPNEAKFIKSVVDETLSKSDGSNCGHDFEQLMIASKALKDGDGAAAEVAFDRAMKIHQLEKEKYAKLNVPFREDKFLTHLKTLQSGNEIELTPHNWVAYQERGISRKANGDLSGAVADYTEAIIQGPRNSALLFLRGTTLAEMGQHNLAIEDYNAILEFEPDNKAIKFLLEQSQRASIAAKVNASGLISNWIEYQELGNDLKSKGDIRGAIENYSKAINTGPKNTALFYLRGISYAELNEHNNAISDFKEGLLVEPNNKTLHFLLNQSEAVIASQKTKEQANDWLKYQESGNQKVKAGDFAGAILDYTEAINRGPKNSALHYLRGSTLALINDHNRAIKDFEAILAIEPENVTIKHLLSKSQLYLAQNKVD